MNDLRVHMTGSEWFSDRSGGLNRYFESLFSAMQRLDGIEISAQAFGSPPANGSSWGPVNQRLISRLKTTRRSVPLPPDAILDRHFCLYGQSPGVGPRRSTLVVHFQGPWSGESAMAGESALSVKTKFVIERLRYERADHFVVLSQRFKDLLTRDYKVDPDSVTVIPPGVDLERFPFKQPTERQDVLCVRRLERRMGIDFLIRSWPQVHLSYPDSRLRIVGKGSDEARLRALVVELGLTEAVSFEGLVSDERLVQLYEECAFTVVPSIELEGFGLIALESLASGRPAIVTDCGGLPDAVRELDSTLIVQPRNVEELVARICDGLAGIRPSAEECRHHAESFSWAGVAQRHLELYKRVQR